MDEGKKWAGLFGTDSVGIWRCYAASSEQKIEKQFVPHNLVAVSRSVQRYGVVTIHMGGVKFPPTFYAANYIYKKPKNGELPSDFP